MPSSVYCFRCLNSSSEGENTLERCGGCKSRSYCSRICQKKDWKDHQPECKADSTFPIHIRFTSSRLHSDDIYYIKASNPAAKDYYILGPYGSMEVVLEQIQARLIVEDASQDYLNLTNMKDAAKSGLEQLNSVLKCGNKIKFQTLRERNPEVAKVLARRQNGEKVSTYRILYTFYDPNILKSNADGPDFGIHSTFATLEAANQKVVDVLLASKSEAGPSTYIQTDKQDGLQRGMLVGTAGVLKILEVRCDRGEKSDPASLDRPIKPYSQDKRTIIDA